MAKTSGGNRGGGGNSNSSKVKKALASAEASIRHNKYETGVVIDSNGNEILRKGGGKRYVSFTKDETAKMKDAIITHNHPSAVGKSGISAIGNSFSVEDILLATSNNAKEMRAVTPTYTFSIQRPKNGWGGATSTQIKSVYERANKRTRDKLETYISRYKGDRAKAIERANVLHFNLVMKEVSKRFGWKYSHKKA